MNRTQIENAASKIIDRCMNTGMAHGVFVSDRNGITLTRSSAPYFDKKVRSPYQTFIGVYDASANASVMSDEIDAAARELK